MVCRYDNNEHGNLNRYIYINFISVYSKYIHQGLYIIDESDSHRLVLTFVHTYNSNINTNVKSSSDCSCKYFVKYFNSRHNNLPSLNLLRLTLI